MVDVDHHSIYQSLMPFYSWPASHSESVKEVLHMLQLEKKVKGELKRKWIFNALPLFRHSIRPFCTGSQQNLFAESLTSESERFALQIKKKTKNKNMCFSKPVTT